MKTAECRYVMYVEELITTLEGLVAGLGGNRKKALDLNFKILKEEVDSLEGLIRFFRNENKDIPKKVKETLVDNFPIGCEVEPKDETEAAIMNVSVGTKAIVTKYEMYGDKRYLTVKWPEGIVALKEGWIPSYFKASKPNDFPIGCEVEPASREDASIMEVPIGSRAIVESFETNGNIKVKWLYGGSSCGWFPWRFKRVSPKK